MIGDRRIFLVIISLMASSIYNQHFSAPAWDDKPLASAALATCKSKKILGVAKLPS